jgi:phosphoenolpyruvate synthase/pyruvate phosphate dikinase
MLMEIRARCAEKIALEFGWPEEKLPLEVFVNRNGPVDYYVDSEAMIVLVRTLHDELIAEPHFLDAEFEEYSRRVEILRHIWESEKLLDKMQLADFFDASLRAWRGVIFSFFVPTFEDISDQTKALAMQSRLASDNFLDETDRVIRRNLKMIYPDQENSEYISINELMSGEIPNKEILAERKKFYILIDRENPVLNPEILASTGIELKAEVIPSDMKEFLGTSACPGIARGKVRIVATKESIPSLNDGEILVCSMTTPAYVPAMKKAAAFITDEGGITCHAAILAREMNKPCIIGTKIATQLLQDGDEVEVDADEGIVRVLKKT